MKNRNLIDFSQECIDEEVPLEDGEALEEKFQTKESENVRHIIELQDTERELEDVQTNF